MGWPSRSENVADRSLRVRLLAVFAAAAAAVLAVPETVPYDPGWVRRCGRGSGCRLPPGRPFLLVGPLVGAAWALAGLRGTADVYAAVVAVVAGVAAVGFALRARRRLS